jgi:two-component system, LuxR family, sensor kinase FixL
MNDYLRLTKAELIERLRSLEADAAQGTAPVHSAIENALQESEARMRAILQTAVDAIITIEEDGFIKSVNPAAEEMFGYKAVELIGKNVNVLMPSPYREEHDGYIANYCRTGRAKIIGIGREVVGQRRDGSVFPMDLAVSEVRFGEKRLFTGFVRDLTDRKNLEQEVLNISDREQRRIGQDLHDGLGAHLTGIELMTRGLQQKLAGKSKREAERAGDIAAYVREAIAQTRSLARGLSPVVHEAEGLMSALQDLAFNTGKMFRITCQFDCDPPVLIADYSVATHLFRIAQEAVSNAVKHGKAKQVIIRLSVAGPKIVLMVKDNGLGLPKDLTQTKGMGLRIMDYRASLIGGSLAVQRDLDGGTSVVCSLQAGDKRRI